MVNKAGSSFLRRMLLALSLMTLSACGLKGDLYLPDPAKEGATETEMTLPDDEETSE